MTAVRPARTLAPLTEESVFIGRSLRHSVRNIDALIMSIVLPVILMLLFTFVFGGALDPDGRYVDYVVPGIILLCAGFGAAGTAVDVATDMQSGIIDRFRTMPIRGWVVLTGHVVASLVRNLFATGIVIGVALAVGFRPDADVSDWLGALALVALYVLAITSLFAMIGLAARNPEAASGSTFFVLFVPYLSSAFVPVDTLPTWLQWIAQNQPVTPIIETMRGLLLGTELTTEPILAIGSCLVILAGSTIGGALLFRRRAGRR